MQNRKMIQDRFAVTQIDPGNKAPFRNVSRIHMKSQYGLQLQVDINTQIYPIHSSDSFLIKVTGCQNIRNVYSHQQLSKPSQRDNYDYVSYGVVFPFNKKMEMLLYLLALVDYQ